MTEPASATVKTVQHEEASRLPDTNWLWRRVLIYVICLGCLVFAWRLCEWVVQHGDIGTIRQMTRYNYGMMALALMLYGVGATVTDVAKLVTSFLSTKKTTETTAPPPATITTSPSGAAKVETPPEADTGELPASERIP
jgi:hypothetical protein